MNILKPQPATTPAAPTLATLIEERTAALAALHELDAFEQLDAEVANMAVSDINQNDAHHLGQGRIPTAAVAAMVRERNAADSRRRSRASELQAGRDRLARINSSIRHQVEAQLALEAGPEQQAVADALVAAFEALDALDERRTALAGEFTVPLAPSAFETAVRAALVAACAAVGMVPPESPPFRQGRAAMLEASGKAKARDRRIRALEEEIARPPAVLAALERQSAVGAQKLREVAGERREDSAIRERLTTLPKAEQERRRKLQQELDEVKRGDA